MAGPGSNDPRYRRGRFYKVTYKSGMTRTVFAFSEADARKEGNRAQITRPDDTVKSVENRGRTP